MIAWIYWDPPRNLFTIPFINHPIAIYGACFAFGFILGFLIILPIICRKLAETSQLPKRALREIALKMTDRLTWYVVAGTVIGARLGHVFFYEWPRYRENPIDIFKIWEGGLASHGGAIGVILALYLYQRTIKKNYPEFTFLTIMDCIAIPTAMTAVWIRIGNFFNQEIVGPVTDLPWAIVFAHPLEGQGGVPRHPSQLYEAVTYLITFFVLYCLWYKKSRQLKPGTLVGLFMILVFGFRFLIEFVKIPSSLIIEENILLTGQYLSLPFIILGICFLFYPQKKSTLLSNK